MEDHAAHRAKSRFVTALPAVLHADGADVVCRAGNVSRAGALLEGRMPVPGSPDVELTLSTAQGDRSVRVRAQLMHAHEDSESGEVRLGVRFEGLTVDQGEAIDSIVSRVVEGMAPAALALIDPKASVGEIRAALSRITPAHRLTLASRTADPVERGILRHDADPHVLEGLARNPNSNLPEIKTLLRRTDLLPSTLEIVAGDPRWTTDEELKIMVATHPRVTFLTADKVVNQLSPLALDRVVRRPGLQPGVKQKLMVRLSRKNRGGG